MATRINLEGKAIEWDVNYSPEGAIDICWAELINEKLTGVAGSFMVSDAQLKLYNEQVPYEKLVIEDYKKGGLK